MSDGVRALVALFRTLPNAKASFATKAVNRDLLAYDPQGKTRIRFSLMPARIARIVDVRTAPIPSGSPPSTTSWPPATRSTPTSRP